MVTVLYIRLKKKLHKKGGINGQVDDISILELQGSLSLESQTIDEQCHDTELCDLKETNTEKNK